MPLTRVLPDTNVLYPMSLLDLILRLDEADLHAVQWTEHLLNELSGTWVRNGARSRASAEKVCDAIRTAFADQEIPTGEYAHLIESMPGKDPRDHGHSAAAVARAPITILTANVKDFPAKPLAELGVTVSRPDTYLCSLAEAHPADVSTVIVEMAADRRAPRMKPSEVLDALERAGVPDFATLMRTKVR